MTFAVFARSTLARTVTRAVAPCAASALRRFASAPPTNSAGHPEDRAGVRIAVPAHLLARHVEREDDSCGARLARGEQLLVQLVEERALVSPARAREFRRDVHADDAERGIRQRGAGEVADDHLARGIRGSDVLVRG